MLPSTVVRSHAFGSHLFPQSNSKIKWIVYMNRKSTNCENLASFAYSSNAIGGKCFYHQIALCVHSFSQPYSPLRATKEDLGEAGEKNNCRRTVFDFHNRNVMCFCMMRHYCSSVNMLLVYGSQNSSRTFLSPASGSVGLESSLMLAFLS